MKTDILCSVIILTYKQLKWLPETLRSITKQDYDNIEIIIADDGTPGFNYNEVKELCEKYCKERGFKYCIAPSEENLGTVKNFNKGINSATGSIIIPMAGDNQFFSKSVVSCIVHSFEKENWLIATGLQVLCENETIKEVRPYENEIAMIKKKTTHKLAIRLAMYPCFIGGAATVYTRELFAKYGLFDERYKLLEDSPYYVSLLLENVKIQFINEILIKHNIDSTSGARSKILADDDIRLIDDLLNGKTYLSLAEKRMLQYRKLLLKEELGERQKYNGYFDCIIRQIWYKVWLKIFRKLQKAKYSNLISKQ